MAKVNRNDKCPCGSGKKYKNCCGASTKVNEPLINGQLNLLHHRLVTHGLSKYNKSVDTFISQYENQPFQDDAQIMSVYILV
ncbi:hypothetical protein JCM21714_4374 [Gracilibacillus boraciitolerans JCM 21714]|uniref:Protein export cytoplasm protein SecA ATPase RNA helicase n=1 Tax=Gracilibacillus boraciitolerans JCM 21714 TaxID=1298598 RepID=W4VPR3_9BACI|nr:SEC-C metal-binding domain-containing protein [Gracilibacillus boraciitolerans]GAE95161.1 hypothetical protein JCM21714_4374 [Gracilibacillus boraciitolerans JCM 21714]